MAVVLTTFSGQGGICQRERQREKVKGKRREKTMIRPLIGFSKSGNAILKSPLDKKTKQINF